jgi:hypothetical protein
MRTRLAIDLAPTWVLVIFFLSLCEAIGLTIYFHADIVDPEVASMQPAFLKARELDTMMAIGPGCNASRAARSANDCKPKSHDLMQAQRPEKQDRITGTSKGSIRSLQRISQRAARPGGK